jgi:UTP--glucose-1-phosphate uridylyltransferase
MIFVTGRNKRAIEDHFDKAYELEKELEADNKQTLLNVLSGIKPKNVECFYVRQAEALGLGHAVLCAERMVHQQPFAVILADDLLDSEIPVVRQMVQMHARHGSSIVGVESILPEQSRSYGVVAGNPAGDRLFRLHGIVEKPAPEQAPSNLGVVGRYILSPGIFSHLRKLRPGAGGELQLTDAIASLMTRETVYAYQFDGMRYDCGSKQGYLQATVQFGLKHPEVGAAFRDYLETTVAPQLGDAFEERLPTAYPQPSYGTIRA